MVLLGALIMIAGSGTASAHSYFMQSDPADGSILENPPPKVVLVFSSPVAPDFTSVELVEAAGSRYSATSVIGYPGHSNIVVVNLPAIPNGSYRLTFVTRDAVDLHATSGTIVFGVGMAPASVGVVPTAAAPVPSEFVLRALALIGLAAILGGLAVCVLVVGRLPGPSATRIRIQRWLLAFALVGSGLLLVAETALLAFQASSLGPLARSTGQVLGGSEYGVRWLVTVLLLVGVTALLGVMWSAARRSEVPGLWQQLTRMRAWALLTTEFRAVLLALALTVAMAFSGHVASAGGTPFSGVMLLALHLGAMGVWVGGLAALGLSLMVLRRAEGRLRGSDLMALVVGFGPIAAISFGLLAATGLLLSGIQVASVTALFSTQYGAVLVAKVALIGIVGLFGVRHALLTWRGLARRGQWVGRIPKRLPLTLALEACGAAVVVLLASVLGASAPARGPQFDPISTSATITQVTREQDGLLLTLSIKPNKAGPNLIGVHVVDTRRPVVAPVSRVTVTLQRPNAIPEVLATTPSGSRYDAGSVKLAAGDVRFTVTVMRVGIVDSAATMSWQVAAPEVARAPVVVSNQRVEPMANAAAQITILLAAGLMIAGVLRYRRTSRRPVLVDLQPPNKHLTTKVANLK